MKTMQPIMTSQLVQDNDYLYEVKYDGFRASLVWMEEHIQLMSRKGIDLSHQFPEIVDSCRKLTHQIKPFLPIELDGELVLLNNPLQGNFYQLQTRGRLKSKQKINEAATERSATFMVFDLLSVKGASIKATSLTRRKQQLQKLFQHIDSTLLQLVPTYPTYAELKKRVFDYQAEGVVAKRRNSKYQIGKKHHDWIKEKNWRTVTGFLIAYHPENGYFDVAVYDNQRIIRIGQCKHGLTDESLHTIRKLFLHEGKKEGTSYVLPPAICVEIYTLSIEYDELREAQFKRVVPDIDAENCTYEKVQVDVAMLPEAVTISNADKLFWPDVHVRKIDHIIYMRTVYPLMLPYLENRAITIIRCPEGIKESCFFQKHVPDYAPDFIKRTTKQQLRCDRLETLVWHTNHSAIECHIPFTHIDNKYPDFIVFDLDPPSRNEFPMAIKAAKLFKKVFEELSLTTFITTSGNKGLQIHLPLPYHMFTYEDTAYFTENIANIIIQAAPDLCTIERFKQNRKGRLYIDYVQHGKNKTIIAPYSPRKIPSAAVATPLNWEEVDNKLSPDAFTIKTIPERMKTKGCPWMFHYEKARTQSFEKALPLFNG